jgi:hypothetical protein
LLTPQTRPWSERAFAWGALALGVSSRCAVERGGRERRTSAIGEHALPSCSGMSLLPIAALAVLMGEPPERSIWTPPLPLADAPETPPAARVGPEILYINFDGAVLQSGCGNDARHDCSTLAALFDGYVGPFTGNDIQRMSVLQATRKAVADFGIRVLIDRPPGDDPYTMVIYGDLGPQSFAGVAPYIDCKDQRPGDTSFSQGFTSSSIGATVILQEAAHTWGLEHVDSALDILNPFKSQISSQRFIDDCLKIVANTDLEPTAGVCNHVHTLFCESGYQNSFREMKLLFGDHVPDVDPPRIEIISPAEGSTYVLPTTISLRAKIEDNLHPQFYEVEIYNGTDLVFQDLSDRIDLLLTDPPEGEYALRIALRDEAGNPAEDTVRFTVLSEGSEYPDHPLDPPDRSDAEGCRLGTPPAAWALTLLAWMLGRRRRHRPC